MLLPQIIWLDRERQEKVECLFSENFGHTKIVYHYSITACCDCQVSPNGLGLGISGQYGSVLGKALLNMSMVLGSAPQDNIAQMQEECLINSYA